MKKILPMSQGSGRRAATAWFLSATFCAVLLYAAPYAEGADVSVVYEIDGATADNWGDSAACPIADANDRSLVVISACGSGKNMDCGGSVVRIGCRMPFFDLGGTGHQGATVGVSEVASSSWGERITCPDGQVVSSICGSGMNPDCAGKTAKITCGGMGYYSRTDGEGTSVFQPQFRDEESFTPISLTTGQSQWISTSDWGGIVTCPEGMIATGYCGSGENKDCSGNVTELRCSVISYDP